MWELGELEKVKKPFYKRWWFIVIVIFFALFVIGGLLEDEQTAEVSNKTKEEQTNDSEENKAEEEEQSDNEKVIELGEEFTSVDYTAKIQRVKIKDDVLTVVFDWENQSEWDPAHFELLGFVSAEQNGESLEEISSDRKYKQIKQGRFDVYDLEYKLIDDSDVTIRVVSTNEYDGSEGKITVSLE